MKRLIDIFISLIALVILSPIFFMVMYKVRKNLPSPRLWCGSRQIGIQCRIVTVRSVVILSRSAIRKSGTHSTINGKKLYLPRVSRARNCWCYKRHYFRNVHSVNAKTRDRSLNIDKRHTRRGTDTINPPTINLHACTIRAKAKKLVVDGAMLPKECTYA